MRVNVTFRHMESSDALKQYAEEKIGKFQKYLRTPLEGEVTFSVEKHLQRVDMNIHEGGKRYVGHEASENMYASIDKVVDKIDRQIRDSHAAQADKRRHRTSLSEQLSNQG